VKEEVAIELEKARAMVKSVAEEIRLFAFAEPP
jgi:hypothetical protein